MAVDGYHPIAPTRVLQEIAAAVPAECRESMITIGSLAVGYRYFASQRAMVVRTKDADCLLAPRVAAIPVGQPSPSNFSPPAGACGQVSMGRGRAMIARRTGYCRPYDCSRRRPPIGFELLTLPASPAERGRQWLRLKTSVGHLGIASFGYLALPSLDPIMTDSGIAIARPEMMALANLLEHPAIGTQTMSGGFAGRPGVKRSNKDLGRVVAIARLATGEDERCWGPGTFSGRRR